MPVKTRYKGSVGAERNSGSPLVFERVNLVEVVHRLRRCLARIFMLMNAQSCTDNFLSVICESSVSSRV